MPANLQHDRTSQQMRAATLIYEPRHVEGSCQHGDDDCARKASCDETYNIGCDGFNSDGGMGANAYQVEWLNAFVSGGDPKWIDPTIKAHAIGVASHPPDCIQ